MKDKLDFDIAVIKLPAALTKCAKAYRQVAARFALSAFFANEGEASSQFEQIGELLARSEACLTFCARLKRALRSLPAKEAELIRRVFAQGMSVAAVAAECGVSLSTVYRKICLARKHFIKALADNGVTKDWVVEEFGDLQLTHKLVRAKYGKTTVFVPEVSAMHLKGLM